MDLSALQDIAQRTGGQYFFADNEAGLEQVYAQIDALILMKLKRNPFAPAKALDTFLWLWP